MKEGKTAEDPAANRDKIDVTPSSVKRSLASRKTGARSSSMGAKSTKEITTTKSVTGGRSTSQSALQKAASKLKAEQARKKEEEQANALAEQQAAQKRRELEQKKIQAQLEYEQQRAKEAREEERERRKEEREEQRKIREEKRNFDAQRRTAAREAIAKAANVEAASIEDLKKIAAQNQFADRFSGMFENSERYHFDPTGARGPSQTVMYSSRFVDRLSDVTEDMCVSAGLSIKHAKVGGSGKGSFVDSDKFKESDLNFYISVKVINQRSTSRTPLSITPFDPLESPARTS